MRLLAHLSCGMSIHRITQLVRNAMSLSRCRFGRVALLVEILYQPGDRIVRSRDQGTRDRFGMMKVFVSCYQSCFYFFKVLSQVPFGRPQNPLHYPIHTRNLGHTRTKKTFRVLFLGCRAIDQLAPLGNVRRFPFAGVGAWLPTCS